MSPIGHTLGGMYDTGLLGVGFEKYGNIEALKSDPIHHLFDVRITQ